MSKFFLDTEFHEYKKKPFIGKPIDTIELISIGIVSEEGKEYYAICNEFDLKSAWNNEWLRDNVLGSIYVDLLKMGQIYGDERNYWDCDYRNMKRLLKWYGKSKKEIAFEVKEFCYNQSEMNKYEGTYDSNPEFYAYFGDYDWVVFCWLFGRMIDLPKGFPMYCKDLKQMLDDRADYELPNQPKGERVDILKNSKRYPQKDNEHNALDDAKWNLELYKFLNFFK